MCTFTKRNISKYACVYIHIYICIRTCIFALYLYIYIDIFMYSIPMEAFLLSCVLRRVSMSISVSMSVFLSVSVCVSLSVFTCMSWMSWHSSKEKEIHQKDGNRTERAKTSHDARRSHSRMSHVTHLNEAYVKRMIESCHLFESFMSLVWMSHISRMNMIRHTNEWVVPYMWVSRVIHINESCHVYIYMNESYRTRECAMSHSTGDTKGALQNKTTN